MIPTQTPRIGTEVMVNIPDHDMYGMLGKITGYRTGMSGILMARVCFGVGWFQHFRPEDLRTL